MRILIRLLFVAALQIGVASSFHQRHRHREQPQLQRKHFRIATSINTIDESSRKKTRERSLSRTTLFSSPTTNNNGLSRRQLGEVAVATIGLGVTAVGTREVDPTDYGLWGILPVGTYKRKKTIRDTIVPDQLWTLEQKFGILNVQVPLRMVVVKMKGGGLFIYNAIAATQECLSFVNELVEKHGPVKHIVVGSGTFCCSMKLTN